MSSKNLDVLRHRLAQVDKEATDLQVKLAQLALERKFILAALQSAYYPVQDLPTDILAEIFMHCVDRAVIGKSPIIAAGPPIRPSGHGPLVLASVCRAWRDIALALPSLWSTMQIITTQDFSATINLLNYWLPRAGTHLLDIDFGIVSVNPLLATIAPYSAQLRALACSIDSDFPRESIRGRVPNLRKLEVSLVLEEEFLGPGGQFDVFLDTPALLDIHLIGPHIDLIALPWVQLTTLRLSDFELRKGLDILQQTPQLQVLVVVSQSDRMPPTRLLSLPHLHTLKFINSNISLLSSLTLPALLHLTLPEVISVTRVVHFFQRSGCALQSINFVGTYSGQMLHCLANVPSVTKVHVADVAWTRHSFVDLFDALTVAEGAEGGLLPNLSALSLCPCVLPVELPYALLADAIASRRPQLEWFELIIAPEASFDPLPTMKEIETGLEKLQTLAAGGMHLNIRGLQKLSSSTSTWGVYPPALQVMSV